MGFVPPEKISLGGPACSSCFAEALNRQVHTQHAV